MKLMKPRNFKTPISHKSLTTSHKQIKKMLKRYNRLWILVLLLAASAGLQAQEYPFIKYEANQLHYDSTSVTMQAFFQKWHRMKQGGNVRVNIMHIGGSHVQAGTFPHRVRTRLLEANPTLVGGRGLLFPYSAAAKCNNPSDYRVHCVEKVELTRNVSGSPAHPLGLCGIAVTAHDVLTRIQIMSNDNIDYGVSRIVVLGYSPDGVVPLLSCDGHNMSPSYIDSAKHRYIFNLSHEVDSFDILLPCSENESFTLTGVKLDSRNAGIIYHSIGVNGAAVPDYLKCALKNDLRMVMPDLVIFGIGINDAHGDHFDSAAFRRNYLRLCDSVRSINPQCAFIFVTNNDCYRKSGRHYSVNRNGLQVRDVFYRLAEETGGAVWDQFEIMGGLTSMQQWQDAGLAQKDKVHFTRAGYQLIGDMLYEAIAKELYSFEVDKVLRRDAGKLHESATPSTSSSNKQQQLRQRDEGTEGLPRGLRRKPHHKLVIKAANTNNNEDAE